MLTAPGLAGSLTLKLTACWKRPVPSPKHPISAISSAWHFSPVLDGANYWVWSGHGWIYGPTSSTLKLLTPRVGYLDRYPCTKRRDKPWTAGNAFAHHFVQMRRLCSSTMRGVRFDQSSDRFPRPAGARISLIFGSTTFDTPSPVGW